MCLASSLAISSVRYTLSDVAPADALLLALPRLGCDSVSCVHSPHLNASSIQGKHPLREILRKGKKQVDRASLFSALQGNRHA